MKKLFLTISLAFGVFFLHGQSENDSIDYAAEIAMLEAELDSFGIFSLIDSVLLAEYKPPSEFNIRFGYNSNVVNAGRNYGLNQHGLTPGISFYHSKGWFADVTGFWNSEFDPKYNLTMISGGYMGLLGNKLSYTISAEKWFYHYNQSSEITSLPSNSVGASASYDLKYLYAGLDYTYMFGNGDAHRLIGSLTGNIKIPAFWKIKSITFMPGFSTLFGNEEVVIQFNGDLIDELKSNEYLKQNLQSEDFQTFLGNVEFSQQEQLTLNFIQRNDRLSERQKRSRTILIYLQNEEILTYLYGLLDQESNSYGIMNYSFSLPVSISFGKFSTLLSYSYSIPVKLPGETIELDPIGFFSLTFSYRIPLR